MRYGRYGSGAALLSRALLATALVTTQAFGRSTGAKAASSVTGSAKALPTMQAASRSVDMVQLPAVDLAKAVGVTQVVHRTGPFSGRRPAQLAEARSALRRPKPR